MLASFHTWAWGIFWVPLAQLYYISVLYTTIALYMQLHGNLFFERTNENTGNQPRNKN